MHHWGYDSWIDRDQNPITLEEWETVVESDSEMKMVNIVAVTSPTGDKIEIEHDGIALWESARDSYQYHFHYADGEIIVRSPRQGTLFDAFIRKMKELAEKLGAKVQGDEHEEY